MVNKEVQKLYAYPEKDESVEAFYRKNPPQRPTLPEILQNISEDQLRKVFFDRIDSFASLVLADYIVGPHSKMHEYLYTNFKNKVHTGAREVIIAPRASSKCLEENTLIQLQSGELKKIKDIEIGDMVCSMNSHYKMEASNSEYVVSKVHSGKKLVRDYIFRSGRRIAMTDEHRLFDIHGELCGRDIQIGTRLAVPRKIPSRNLDSDNQKLIDLATSDIYWDEIVKISDYYEADTYDIETSKNHNFIANNVISHNSTIMTLALPLWAICFSQYHFIVIASDTADQAEDFLAWIKDELETNEVIEYLFPEVFGSGTIWRKDRLVTKNGILVRAMGSGGKIRGRRWKKYRVELVLLDDAENKQMMDSDTLRKGLITWFDQDVCKAGSRAQDLDIFVAGTILHKESLLNQLYESDKYVNWNAIKYQAVEKWSEEKSLWNEWKRILSNRYEDRRMWEAYRYFILHKSRMIAGTHVLWEGWDTYYQLMLEMQMDGELAFYRERQNLPMSPTEKVFDIDRFSYYTDEEFDKLDKRDMIFVAYLDSALGHKQHKRDFSAFTYLAKHVPTGYIFVRAATRKKQVVTKQIDEILTYLEQGDITRIGIESNGFQVLVGDNLKTEMISRGLKAKIISIQHNMDKNARIESLEPYIHNGTIKFRRRQDAELISTLEWYPYGHDDSADSLEGAFSMLNHKVFVPTFARANKKLVIPSKLVDTYAGRYATRKSARQFRYD